MWWKSFELKDILSATTTTTTTTTTTNAHLSFRKYTLLPHTQPRVTYAEITKQNSYAITNIEQEPHINQSHQQTRDIQELKKNGYELFRTNGNYAKPPDNRT
jgi:hypothetical protein